MTTEQPFSAKDLILREVDVKHHKSVTTGIVVKVVPPIVHVVVVQGKSYETTIVPYSCIVKIGRKIEDTVEELLTSDRAYLRKIGLDVYKRLNSESAK